MLANNLSLVENANSNGHSPARVTVNVESSE